MESYPAPVVILANGPFPSHSIPLGRLEKAATIICTNGSADKLLTWGRSPQVILGDLDSTRLEEERFQGKWIPLPGQENTDLEKALDWCRRKGIPEVTIVGASGGRDDHTVANYRLLAVYCQEIEVSMVTDFATISCHQGKKSFRSFSGQVVSLFPVQAIRRVTTANLKYKLNNETLPPSSRGISNLSLATSFTVSASEPLWVFRIHPE